MADKIKGITVKIGGDTAPLSKALKKVNKEITNTETELKEVEKLLKLDPSHVETLKEKQSLLSKQIATTTKKLEALKKAQGEAAEMLANGEIGQKEYEELCKQVEKCETDLENLKAEAKDVGDQVAPSAEKIGEAFEAAGDKIIAAGEALAPFSAAAAAGLGVAVKTTGDFDQAMSEVAAISGATGEDFEALRAKAREMGETTKFSASESAEAFKYMAMAGWKTEQMLDGIEGVMSLAAASGEDLGTTSDIVTDALTALGYKAEDAGRLADVMAAASSNANTNVGMMRETFKYAASVCGSYGYTMEDLALATGLMANSGIKASQAGTSLRSIMSRLATNAGASSNALGALDILTKKLGVDFYDTAGNMRPFRDVIQEARVAWAGLTKEEQATYSKTIAGQRAMTGWMAIMNASEEDVNKLSTAIDNSNGTAKEMADTMLDNLPGQLTILKSQLQELAISIGDILMPTIRDIVSWVQSLVDKFNNLDEGTKEIIAKIAVFVAALSPALLIGGKIVKIIGKVIAFIPTITEFLTGIGGPIAIAVAAIGGLVYAISSYRKGLKEAYDKAAALTEEQQAMVDEINAESDAWKEVKQSRKDAYADIQSQTENEKALWKQLKKVVDATGKVKEGHEAEAEVIVNQLQEALGIEINLIDGQIENYDSLCDSIDTVIARKAAEAMLAADEENYTNALKNRKNAAVTVAQAEKKVADQEKVVAEQAAEVERLERLLAQAEADLGDETGAGYATRQKYNNELATAKQTLEGAKENLDKMKQAEADAKENLQEYNTTIGNYEDLLDAISSGSIPDMEDAVENLSNSLVTAKNGTKETLEAQTQAFLDEYSNMRDIVDETGSEAAEDAADNMEALVNKSIEELEKLDPELAEEMKTQLNTINENSESWKDAGKDKGTKYGEGLKDGVDSVNLPAHVKKKLGNGKAYTWGKELAQNYANGIVANTPQVTTAASQLAKKVHEYIGFSEPEKGPLSDFHTYGPDMMALLASGIRSSEWEVLQAAQGVASTLRDTLQGTTLTAQLDQKSIPLGTGVTLNIANFNNYSDSDIRELTNEIMETAAAFAARKGAVFA